MTLLKFMRETSTNRKFPATAMAVVILPLLLIGAIALTGCEEEPDDGFSIIKPIPTLNAVGVKHFALYVGQLDLFAVVDRVGEDSTVISRTCGQTLTFNGELAFPVTTAQEYPVLTPAPPARNPLLRLGQRYASCLRRV